MEALDVSYELPDTPEKEIIVNRIKAALRILRREDLNREE